MLKIKRYLLTISIFFVVFFGIPLFCLAATPTYLIIDGVTYNTAQLEMNPSGSGWSWDNSSNTLTLSNYDSSRIEANGDLIITMTSGTDNVVTNTTDNSPAIYVTTGILTLTGSGNLNIQQNSTGGVAHGIQIGSYSYAGISSLLQVKMEGNLTINSYRAGIYSQKGGIEFSGSGDVDVNCSAGSGLFTNSGNIIFSGNSSINVKARIRGVSIQQTTGRLIIESTGTPLKLSGDSRAVGIVNDPNINPVVINNPTYYNAQSGSWNSPSVKYFHVSELTGEANLNLNSETGNISVSINNNDIASINNLVYTWSDGSNGATASSTLGVPISCTVTLPEATGAITTTPITVYKTEASLSNNITGDTFTIAKPYGKVGDIIDINYTISNTGFANNNITFTGGTVTKTTPNKATYTVNASDASDGIINITAIFEHHFLSSLYITNKGYTASELTNNINKADEGWSWNANTGEITLSNYNSSRIQANGNLIIIMTEGTNNTINGGRTIETTNYTNGNVTLKGDGNLSLISLSNAGYGIYTPNNKNLTVSLEMNGDLTINSGTTGIYTYGNIEHKGDGDITINSNAGTCMFSFNGDVIFSGNGKVNLKSRDYYAVGTNHAAGRLKLQGTGSPLHFSGKNIAVCHRNNPSYSIIESSDYYDKITGSWNTASVTYSHTPELSGTLNLSLNRSTGEITAETSGIDTDLVGDLTYTWNDGVISKNRMPILGEEMTCTITAPSASGSISTSITVYKIEVNKINNIGNDNVSITNPYTETGNNININYTVDDSGTANNNLTFSGAINKTVNGTGIEAYTTNPSHAVNGIITINADFSHINHHAVIIDNTGIGAIGAANYIAGSLVNIDAGIKNNYTFSHWSSLDGIVFDNASSSNTTFLMPDHPVTIKANWNIITYTITSLANSNGSINPAGINLVNSGTDQVYTIIANPNYHISDVLIDGISIGPTPSYTFNNISTNHTITVDFAKNSTNNSSGGFCHACLSSPTTPPNGFKLDINDGALETSDSKVILKFNAGPDIDKIALSRTGDFSDTILEQYTPLKNWNLCQQEICPDGQYTIYAKFYTTYGHSSDTSIASSSIILKSQEDILEDIKEEPQPTCQTPLYPKTPIKFGSDKNNPDDVKLLQQFLNTYEEFNLPVDGIYSSQSRDAVIKWQEKYTEEVLKPWGLNKGSGYIFKTSLKKIKDIQEAKCKKIKIKILPLEEILLIIEIFV